MGSIIRATAVVVFLVLTSSGAAAPQDEAARQAYFRAVGEHFELPSTEISILGDWRLPADEIPVVLFIAQRAGVSPEALSALRRSGTSWADLASRYRVDPGAFHVPLPTDIPAGRLAGAYLQFRGTPSERWHEIRLTDSDVVALVNLRMLSAVLDLSVEEILEEAGATGSFVALHAALISNDRPR